MKPQKQSPPDEETIKQALQLLEGIATRAGDALDELHVTGPYSEVQRFRPGKAGHNLFAHLRDRGHLTPTGIRLGALRVFELHLNPAPAATPAAQTTNPDLNEAVNLVLRSKARPDGGHLLIIGPSLILVDHFGEKRGNAVHSALRRRRILVPSGKRAGARRISFFYPDKLKEEAPSGPRQHLNEKKRRAAALKAAATRRANTAAWGQSFKDAKVRIHLEQIDRLQRETELHKAALRRQGLRIVRIKGKSAVLPA